MHIKYLGTNIYKHYSSFVDNQNGDFYQKCFPSGILKSAKIRMQDIKIERTGNKYRRVMHLHLKIT